jgi:aminoglycoside phosphotransferase (APT) family kinase protein
VPEVVDPGWGTRAPGLLATTFVEGEPGAALLGRTGGPAAVGEVFGAAWEAMHAVDTEGIELPLSWCSGPGLAAAGDAVRRAIAAVGPGARPRLIREVAVAREVLGGRQTALVHGDFVPVNGLIRDGTLVGLIDFESAGLADPLTDPAWFAWIVGYHHPAVAAAAWSSFLAAAGLETDDRATRTLLRILPLLAMLERLDGAREEAQRGRWIGMLRRFAGA